MVVSRVEFVDDSEFERWQRSGNSGGCGRPGKDSASELGAAPRVEGVAAQEPRSCACRDHSILQDVVLPRVRSRQWQNSTDQQQRFRVACSIVDSDRFQRAQRQSWPRRRCRLEIAEHGYSAGFCAEQLVCLCVGTSTDGHEHVINSAPPVACAAGILAETGPESRLRFEVRPWSASNFELLRFQILDLTCPCR